MLLIAPSASVEARNSAPARGGQEAWTLTCESPENTVRSARQVFVDRGERVSLDLRKDCKAKRG